MVSLGCRVTKHLYIVYHTETPKPRSTATSQLLVEKGGNLNAKDIAQSMFDRIGDGNKNAIGRPDNPSVDRQLRSLIERANMNGDVIISGMNGYYRPIPGRLIDDMEYKAYMAKEKARIDSLRVKQECMQVAYAHRQLEVETCVK